jgi:hypothetical protein
MLYLEKNDANPNILERNGTRCSPWNFGCPDQKIGFRALRFNRPLTPPDEDAVLGAKPDIQLATILGRQRMRIHMR